MASFKDKFKYAFHGMKLIFHDSAVQIQIMLMCMAIIFAGLLKFNQMEWCITLICCALVIACEIINSLIEKIMDFIHPEYHEKIKVIKDMSAGMVLFVCILVFMIGMILYGSHVWLLLRGI